MASTALSQDPELYFRFNHFLMEHSSVNGLVNETTVQQMYDMIVENARKYLDTPAAPDAKQFRTKGMEQKKPQEQLAGRNSTYYACYHCGSKEHLVKGLSAQTSTNKSTSENTAQGSAAKEA